MLSQKLQILKHSTGNCLCDVNATFNQQRNIFPLTWTLTSLTRYCEKGPLNLQSNDGIQKETSWRNYLTTTEEDGPCGQWRGYLSDELSFLQNLNTPLRDPLSNLKNSIRITEIKQRSIAFKDIYTLRQHQKGSSCVSSQTKQPAIRHCCLLHRHRYVSSAEYFAAKPKQTPQQ